MERGDNPKALDSALAGALEWCRSAKVELLELGISVLIVVGAGGALLKRAHPWLEICLVALGARELWGS